MTTGTGMGIRGDGGTNGESIGRHGRKTGGAGHTGETSVNQGALTCPRCRGSGKISRPSAEADPDGVFSGADVLDCPRCDATGKVSS